MPYTPTPIRLVTPADSVHGCFEVCNENFSDIEATLTEVSSLISGSGFDYFKTGLTGGTSGMLDQVDGNGLTGDERAVVVVGNNPARVYFYVLDVDNASAEDSPYIIAPDTNAGDKRWILAARIPRIWKGAGTPTTTDDYNDGVRNGDWWLYGGNAWMCVSESAGAAVWRLIPQLGTGSTNAASGNHDHSTSNIASTAVSDWAEAVQDTAGAMWSSNTETGLSVTYDDATGKLNASVTYGTDANTACQGNDSRLSNTRTPVAHNFIDTTGHPVTGLTTGNVVAATGATTYGFGDVGSIVYVATAKNAPVDADCLALSDSEASPTAGILKKLTWSYVKSVLKTYFDGLYVQLAGDLGGTVSAPTVTRIHSGVTQLSISTITDGQFLKRVGTDIVSAEAAGNNYATVTAGEAIAQYDIIYVDTTDGNKVKKALNNGTQAQSDVLGMALAAISDDGSGTAILSGTVTNGAWTWTPNRWLYLNSTAGGLTHTCPTVNGVYAVPVAIAQSATQIYIQPMTGWVVNNSDNIALGCKKVSFDETSGTVAIITPPANAVVTQITAVITNAAAGSGGTIEIGVSGNTDSVVATTVFDLTQAGNHVYDPFYSVGGSPDEYILSTIAGGQVFSGVLYFHYVIPNVFNGVGGVASLSFTQSSLDLTLLVTLPENVVVQRCVTVVDTGASGSPTISIGTVGDSDLLFDETDCDLSTEGIYLYDPFVEISGNVYLTLNNHGSSGVVGRVYLQYLALQ